MSKRVLTENDINAALDAALNDGIRHAASTARELADKMQAAPLEQPISGPEALRVLAMGLELALAHPDERRIMAEALKLATQSPEVQRLTRVFNAPPPKGGQT